MGRYDGDTRAGRAGDALLDLIYAAGLFVAAVLAGGLGVVSIAESSGGGGFVLLALAVVLVVGGGYFVVRAIGGRSRR